MHRLGLFVLVRIMLTASSEDHLWTQSTDYIYGENNGIVIPDIELESDDFVFVAKITPSDTSAGTIIARHKSGIGRGFALNLYPSLHLYFIAWAPEMTGYQMGSGHISSCVKDTSTLDFGGAWGMDLVSAYALEVGVEYTIALVRKGSTLELYVDEELSCSADFAAWDESSDVFGTILGVGAENSMMIGAHYYGDSPTSNPFNGIITDAYIDEGNVYPPPKNTNCTLEADASSPVSEILGDLICLCDEYASVGHHVGQGWLLEERESLTPKLQELILTLKDAGNNEDIESDANYLTSWNRRFQFVHALTHNEAHHFDINKRIWRKGCRGIRVVQERLEGWAERFDDSESSP